MTVLSGSALAGKVVLVSGGTQGVGAAAARTAARCGAEAVVVTGRRPEAAERLVDELDALGTEPLFIRCDLRDIEATIAWVAPELNLEIRAREVHIHLRDPKGRLLPGSLISARFETALGGDLEVADVAKPETWGKFPLIPKTAVLSTGVRHVAWRVAERQRDGRLRFELAALALGPRLEDESGNDVYVVRAGLKAGDEVATQGVFLIDSQAQLAGTASLLFPKGAVAPAGSHQH